MRVTFRDHEESTSNTPFFANFLGSEKRNPYFHLLLLLYLDFVPSGRSRRSAIPLSKIPTDSQKPINLLLSLRQNRLSSSSSQLPPNLNNQTPLPKPFNLNWLKNATSICYQSKRTKNHSLPRLKIRNDIKSIEFSILRIKSNESLKMIPPHGRAKSMTNDG
jgi:hypothetical protein